MYCISFWIPSDGSWDTMYQQFVNEIVLWFNIFFSYSAIESTSYKIWFLVKRGSP